MNQGKDFRAEQNLATDAVQTLADHVDIAHLEWAAADAVVASTTGVLAAFATSTAATEKTTGFTQPSVPRNITATAGGTAGDIKAVQVVVEGTNMADEVISESLPAFTVDTAGSVVGSKAFKTITKVTVPAMDGAGATVAIGFGEKLGLPYKLDKNTVIPGMTFRNKTREGTEPTVTVSSSAIESNTIDLNSALNGSIVETHIIV